MDVYKADVKREFSSNETLQYPGTCDKEALGIEYTYYNRPTENKNVLHLNVGLVDSLKGVKGQ